MDLNSWRELIGYKKPVAVELDNTTKLNKYYNECFILPDGKVVELSGSHEQTASWYFNDDLETIPLNLYGLNYWILKYNLVMVNHRNVIQYDARCLTQSQKYIIEKMKVRNLLSMTCKEIDISIDGAVDHIWKDNDGNLRID